MASKLTYILQTKVLGKIDANGGTIDHPLYGGLHIHLRKDGGSYVLTIWRERTPPSAQEWNTVCAHWPYRLGAPNWSQAGVTASGKYFKQARIPVN